MDRRVWWATIHGVARVGHGLATKEKERPLCLDMSLLSWQGAGPWQVWGLATRVPQAELLIGLMEAGCSPIPTQASAFGLLPRLPLGRPEPELCSRISCLASLPLLGVSIHPCPPGILIPRSSKLSSAFESVGASLIIGLLPYFGLISALFFFCLLKARLPEEGEGRRETTPGDQEENLSAKISKTASSLHHNDGNV